MTEFKVAQMLSSNLLVSSLIWFNADINGYPIMRLTQDQIETIRHSVQDIYGNNARVWLFGSRVDDNRRGGDIDLLIQPDESEQVSLAHKIRFLVKLELAFGERKIDVVIEKPGDQRDIVRIAHETGIQL
jgi:uncharacterized protein